MNEMKGRRWNTWSHKQGHDFDDHSNCVLGFLSMAVFSIKVVIHIELEHGLYADYSYILKKSDHDLYSYCPTS